MCHSKVTIIIMKRVKGTVYSAFICSKIGDIVTSISLLAASKYQIPYSSFSVIRIRAGSVHLLIHAMLLSKTVLFFSKSEQEIFISIRINIV